jgi:hypothetical protein
MKNLSGLLLCLFLCLPCNWFLDWYFPGPDSSIEEHLREE